jgi:hypothetical protein
MVGPLPRPCICGSSSAPGCPFFFFFMFIDFSFTCSWVYYIVLVDIKDWSIFIQCAFICLYSFIWNYNWLSHDCLNCGKILALHCVTRSCSYGNINSWKYSLYELMKEGATDSEVIAGAKFANTHYLSVFYKMVTSTKYGMISSWQIYAA